MYLRKNGSHGEDLESMHISCCQDIYESVANAGVGIYLDESTTYRNKFICEVATHFLLSTAMGKYIYANELVLLAPRVP